jgi:2-C-methyl-D-erythritol 4-phosphate cytidylyltransferase/2-C-methyl-D-erythritol 2,4-cyclodiphosphate synthase
MQTGEQRAKSAPEIREKFDMAGVAAVVVAGGRGLRAGGSHPKQFRPLAGQTPLRIALQAFAEHPGVDLVQPVIHADDEARFTQEADGLAVLPPATGGATRQNSVFAGLDALESHAPEIVLIHDAARPFASATLISRSIAAASQFGAAVPAIEVMDAVKMVDADGGITGNIDRNDVRLVQTPQAFRFAPLYDAHRKAAAAGRNDFPDDAALAQWSGMKVNVFEGEHANIKLTTGGDFVRAEARMLRDIRTGSGIDVHAFGPGNHVMLGGVRIPHDRALAGHSDADVVLHAVVDAILGALADGDIGVHFPPSDPQWRGASSDRFVNFAMERLAKRGGRISHIDVNIVCESPRIGPHRDAMRARIAELCALEIDRVAIKATTSEGLGFTGRGEGIAAFVTATVRLPARSRDA